MPIMPCKKKIALFLFAITPVRMTNEKIQKYNQTNQINFFISCTAREYISSEDYIAPKAKN